jgi:hypothetical protein
MAKTVKMKSKLPTKLTVEQQSIVDEVIGGNSILVEAVIGSGKTTLLESIYNSLSDKNILYLTFNRLLKEEAQSRLKKRKGSVIQNYHGFTYPYSLRAGVKSSISDGLKAFRQAHRKELFRVDQFDVVLIDEYQDLDEDMSQVLMAIKEDNPDIQVVAVGDINQKIYDRTTLNPMEFIHEFKHNMGVRQLSTCFRINEGLGNYLGRVWKTEIIGVNEECKVEVLTKEEARSKMLELEPYQILVLGASAAGERIWLQTELETKDPTRFNKATLYSDLSESEGRVCKDTSRAAVFCTYDKCKGMERDYVFVVGFNRSYWQVRKGAQYTILRNIFSVAASRGKKGIYFISDSSDVLEEMEQALKTPYDRSKSLNVNISKVSEFKKSELVDKVYGQIEFEVIQEPSELLKVTENDHFIELLPVIGQWLEADHFKCFDKYRQYESMPRNQIKDEVSRQIEPYLNELAVAKGYTKTFKTLEEVEKKSVFNTMPTIKYVLISTAIDTGQLRYLTQVDVQMLCDEVSQEIHSRLGSKFDRDHENIQVPVGLEYKGWETEYRLTGLMDAVLGKIPYEFKFASSLSKAHFIQLATYLLASGEPKGFLWNIRTNELVSVSIPNREKYAQELYSMIDG